MKRSRHAQVFKNFPNCIYCGGLEVATTVDHVPARNLFDGKVRPKGLEFPSCLACNNGTRVSELVVAALSRTYPDSSSEIAQKDLEQVFAGLGNNAPDVLRELYMPKAKAKFAAQRFGDPDGGFLKLDGPLVSAHLEIFAAKLGFAFHFYATGKPIPLGGGVISAGYSNINMLEGNIPDDFISLFGQPKTLQQGIKHVGDQFRFGAVATDGGSMSAGFASFREALAFATFSADQVSKLMVDGRFPTRLFKPGDLRNPVVSSEFPTISAVFISKK